MSYVALGTGVNMCVNWDRVPAKKCPAIRRVLVSGVWVEMKVNLHFQSGVVEWGGIKVKKVEKVGFAVHRASFVFF